MKQKILFTWWSMDADYNQSEMLDTDEQMIEKIKELRREGFHTFHIKCYDGLDGKG